MCCARHNTLKVGANGLNFRINSAERRGIMHGLMYANGAGIKGAYIPHFSWILLYVSLPSLSLWI